MRYEYFALDIDGTIFSSESIIYFAYQEAIEKYCATQKLTLAVPSRHQIMLEIGKPVKQIFANLFPELGAEVRHEISESVLQILCNKIARGEGEYYADIRESVERLLARGKKILVASNGRQPYIDAILNHLQILPNISYPTYIDGLRCHTKADILKSYLSRGIDARSILMVGDRASDFEASRAVSCDFAWCSYGHAPPGEIREFEIELKKFSDLLDYA